MRLRMHIVYMLRFQLIRFSLKQFIGWKLHATITIHSINSIMELESLKLLFLLNELYLAIIILGLHFFAIAFKVYIIHLWNMEYNTRILTALYEWRPASMWICELEFIPATCSAAYLGYGSGSLTYGATMSHWPIIWKAVA